MEAQSVGESPAANPVQKAQYDYDVLVIGSGFGGSMTALTLAQKLKDKKPRILILERGTWWTTPVPTVQDPAVATYGFLKKQPNRPPVQFWPSVEHFKGFIDILTRCLRRPGNEDGLYDLTQFGRRGVLGLFGGENDGVTVLRACGVGGGSLVYSNITIRPPNFVLEDSRWPLTWTSDERTQYYELARHAIGYGVVSAWTEAAPDFPANSGNIPYKKDAGAPPSNAINAGLSNISARSARLNPGWSHRQDPKDGRDIKYLNLNLGPASPDPQNRYWIDRARIFQSAMAGLGVEHGTVDSAINDLTPEGSPLDPRDPKNYPGKPINYCERQGRCNVGCLPGARHTLNKQLMMATYGKFDGTLPRTFENFDVQALAEVNVIRALPEGGYAVDYWQRSETNPSQKTEKTLRSKYVVVAAGCLGANEIMQRSSVRHGGALYLSPKLGFGFSTNGDYIAFAENLDFKVGLSRGPVTTSFAHFNSTESDPKADASKFHILEDQGIPRALASTVGFGVPLINSLSNGRHRQPKLLLLWTIILWLWHRVASLIVSLFRNAQERQKDFESEDELTYNMMCVVAAGRDQSLGQFRLGESRRDSPLRVRRTDGKPFHKDPIYKEIEVSLQKLAEKLPSKEPFRNPFLSPVTGELVGKSVTVSHPLGGCPMGKSADSGVVDEYGRVFRAQPKGGESPFYDGLYVADAAIIPTALGVNPSLTIAALALRIANRLSEELASKL